MIPQSESGILRLLKFSTWSKTAKVQSHSIPLPFQAWSVILVLKNPFSKENLTNVEKEILVTGGEDGHVSVTLLGLNRPTYSNYKGHKVEDEENLDERSIEDIEFLTLWIVFLWVD